MSFFTRHKILPNLVDSCWLWWIIRRILTYQKQGNILNEYNGNTYYCLCYSYWNHSQTVLNLSPVSDEKRFPRVWRKVNSFWEEKKHVQLLSDTGLINFLYKLPVNNSVILRNKQTYCVSDLTTWLTDKSDWSEQLLAVLPE